MAFSDAVKKARKKTGKAPGEGKAENRPDGPDAPREEGGEGRPFQKNGGKKPKGAKGGGGFKKAVKNAKKKAKSCKGKKC